MDLSILICSIVERSSSLDRLLICLKPQLSDNVECLTEIDNKEKPIGAKRNNLIMRACGEYISFIDDDDLVSEDYIAKILNAIQSKPDCVGIEGIITFDGEHPRKFIHSIKCDSWHEKDNVYYRYPNHLNPIKRSIAREIAFPLINFGEDKQYSDAIRPLLKTEVFIDGPIYHYLYSKPLNPPRQHNQPIIPKLRHPIITNVRRPRR